MFRDPLAPREFKVLRVQWEPPALPARSALVALPAPRAQLVLLVLPARLVLPAPLVPRVLPALLVLPVLREPFLRT